MGHRAGAELAKRAHRGVEFQRRNELAGRRSAPGLVLSDGADAQRPHRLPGGLCAKSHADRRAVRHRPIELSRGLSRLPIAPENAVLLPRSREDHPTQPATLYTHSLGLLAQLSPHTRFQVQADVLDGVVSGAYHTGLGYTFEFQRNFSDTESLSLKYRLCPSEFNTLTNHVGVEIGFHHTF